MSLVGFVDVAGPQSKTGGRYSSKGLDFAEYLEHELKVPSGTFISTFKNFLSDAYKGFDDLLHAENVVHDTRLDPLQDTLDDAQSV